MSDLIAKRWFQQFIEGCIKCTDKVKPILILEKASEEFFAINRAFYWWNHLLQGKTIDENFYFEVLRKQCYAIQTEALRNALTKVFFHS